MRLRFVLTGLAAWVGLSASSVFAVVGQGVVNTIVTEPCAICSDSPLSRTRGDEGQAYTPDLSGPGDSATPAWESFQPELSGVPER